MQLQLDTRSYLHEQQLAAQVRRTEISSSSELRLQLPEPLEVSDKHRLIYHLVTKSQMTCDKNTAVMCT